MPFGVRLSIPLLLQLFAFKIGSLETNETIFIRDVSSAAIKIPLQISNVLQGPINKRDVKYYLYTRHHNNFSIGRNLNCVHRKFPIKVLIHGWTEHPDVGWYKDIIKAYMKTGLYTIIAIDWSLRGDTDYVSAARNAKLVGAIIGEFLLDLNGKRGIPYKNFHLVSHSLGAHVAGFAGKRVASLSKEKIGRITALDPASLLFDLFVNSPEDRLDRKDAQFVDIVHTDGRMLGFGYSIGTVDFYPNGGTALQPGCSLMKLDIKYEDLFCSHASSHRLFINSILGRRFTAKRCGSWEKFDNGECNNQQPVEFGENVPKNIAGNYYFRTEDRDIVVV